MNYVEERLTSTLKHEFKGLAKIVFYLLIRFINALI